MSEVSNELLESLRAIRRRWMIVAVTVAVVGAVAALYGWRTQAAVGWAASARVRVGAVVSVPYVYEPPPMGAYIVMANSPQVREAVAATLGVKPSALGAYSVASDSTDVRLLMVTAHGGTREEAERIALAVAEAARAKTLDLVRPALEHEQRLVAQATPRVEAMRARARAIAGSGRLAEAQLADEEVLTAEKALSESTFLVETYGSLVSRPELQSASRTSNTRYLVSTVLQGLVVGLFVGVFGALVLDRRARRRA